MDPITTAIVAALAKLSEPAIKDAYEGVKAVSARKFGGKGAVVAAMTAVEAKPDSTGRQTVLDEEISGVNAAADDELVAAVKVLTDKLEQAGVPAGSVHVEAKGKRSVAIGGSVSGSTIRTGDEESGQRRT